MASLVLLCSFGTIFGTSSPLNCFGNYKSSALKDWPRGRTRTHGARTRAYTGGTVFMSLDSYFQFHTTLKGGLKRNLPGEVRENFASEATR